MRDAIQARWMGCSWCDTSDDSVTYNMGVIASQTLAFATSTPNDQDVLADTMSRLIVPGFDPQRQINGALMYNLSCYYAATGDKPRLLQSVAAARRSGKPFKQFLRDKDFERHWEDADFQAALAARP